MELAIPDSLAHNAEGIWQRFVRFSSIGHPVPIRSYRHWPRAAVVTLIAGPTWVPVPTAHVQSSTNDANLSASALYADSTFFRGMANFSEGIEKGFESLGKAFMNALPPRLGDRLTLTPAFTQGGTSYTVTISYAVTSFSLITSGSHPGTTIEVTDMGADGTPLKTGSSINDLNITPEETEMRVDIFRSFKQVPLGKNTITVEVASNDGSTIQTTAVAVGRLNPDMNNQKERDPFFLESIVDEDADGVRRAIEAGADE